MIQVSEIDPAKFYPVSEIAHLMNLREETIKKKLRNKEVFGKPIGTKGVWHVKGSAILKFRADFNLDDAG